MRPGRKKLAAVIDGRLKRGDGLSKLAKEIAAYLLASGRSSELESIMRDVIELRADSGTVETSLSLAHKLDDKTRKEIRQLVKTIRPKAKTLLFDEEIDPGLIGGLKLHVINQSLDLSVRAKLNKLRQLTIQDGA